MRAAVLTLVFTAASLLQGCGLESGRVYQHPIEEARIILGKTGLPPQVFGSEDPEYSMDLSDPAKVIWILTQNRAEILRYEAELTSENERATRVNLTMHAPSSGVHGDIAARFNANPSIRNLYQTAMEENVASALEDRPYNMAAIYPHLMEATIANVGRLQASADEAAAASEQRERDNIARAYEEEAAGNRR